MEFYSDPWPGGQGDGSTIEVNRSSEIIHHPSRVEYSDHGDKWNKNHYTGKNNKWSPEVKPDIESNCI